jgi:hypothetical protein
MEARTVIERLGMQQDGQKYSREAGTAAEQSEYKVEAGIGVVQLGMRQDNQKYSMEAGTAAGQSEI